MINGTVGNCFLRLCDGGGTFVVGDIPSSLYHEGAMLDVCFTSNGESCGKGRFHIIDIKKGVKGSTLTIVWSGEIPIPQSMALVAHPCDPRSM